VGRRRECGRRARELRRQLASRQCNCSPRARSRRAGSGAGLGSRPTIPDSRVSLRVDRAFRFRGAKPRPRLGSDSRRFAVALKGTVRVSARGSGESKSNSALNGGLTRRVFARFCMSKQSRRFSDEGAFGACRVSNGTKQTVVLESRDRESDARVRSFHGLGGSSAADSLHADAKARSSLSEQPPSRERARAHPRAHAHAHARPSTRRPRAHRQRLD
jgi:hypothetical protein